MYSENFQTSLALIEEKKFFTLGHLWQTSKLSAQCFCKFRIWNGKASLSLNTNSDFCFFHEKIVVFKFQ
jgi:hypothetical protein